MFHDQQTSKMKTSHTTKSIRGDESACVDCMHIERKKSAPSMSFVASEFQQEEGRKQDERAKNESKSREFQWWWKQAAQVC